MPSAEQPAGMENVVDLGDHIHIGSKQAPQTLAEVAVVHSSDTQTSHHQSSAFQNLHTKLSNHLTSQFQTLHIPLPDGKPIRLSVTNTVVIFSRTILSVTGPNCLALSRL